jgi:hypothetical protein
MTRRINALITLAALLGLAGLGREPLAAPFQTSGTYIYKAEGEALGQERFFTEEISGGFRIHSHTDLDLGTYILEQSSVLEVDLQGALRSLRITGNSGGKPIGLVARVLGMSLYIEDTVRREATVVSYEEPFHWLAGNFMQHLILAFSHYDRGLQGRQEIPTQAGPLVVDFVESTGLQGEAETISVDHYRISWEDAVLEIYVDREDLVDLIALEDQGVMIYRSGCEDWTVAAVPGSAGEGIDAGTHDPEVSD